MKPQIRFNAVSLEGNPLQADKGDLKIKLFFESNGEDEENYAEVFTNIECGEELLEVREKDPGYRAPLVKAITDQA